mgnify:CR=1 FL=1
MINDFHAGKVVILNVHNGRHWVLTTGITGTTFHVNDPGFNVGSYASSEVVRAGIYRKTAEFIEPTEEVPTEASTDDYCEAEDVPEDFVFDFVDEEEKPEFLA